MLLTLHSAKGLVGSCSDCFLPEWRVRRFVIHIILMPQIPRSVNSLWQLSTKQFSYLGPSKKERNLFTPKLPKPHFEVGVKYLETFMKLWEDERACSKPERGTRKALTSHLSSKVPRALHTNGNCIPQLSQLANTRCFSQLPCSYLCACTWPPQHRNLELFLPPLTKGPLVHKDFLCEKRNFDLTY